MPGSNRAVFLDRDGTIVHDPGYISRPDQLSLIDGAADGIARLRQAGFLVILATNQSAIARGMMTEDDLSAIHDRLAVMLADANPEAKIDAIYYCPFHPEAKAAAYKQESYLRKPRPGMLFKAAREHQLDLGSCWMVGDSERDVQAGKTAGCRAVRIDPDPETETMADKVLPSLAQAAELIIASPGRTPLRASPPAESAPGEPAPVAVAVDPTAVAPATVEVPPGETAPGQIESGARASGAAEGVAAAEVAADAPAARAGSNDEPDGAGTRAETEQSAGGTQPGKPEEDLVPPPPLPDKPGPGRTRQRLLRQIEEDRKRALATPGQPADPLTADKTARPLDTGNLRHVLAEILQQVRQLNRGPAKAERSASKMLGGLFQAGSWGLFAAAIISMFSESADFRSLTWATLGVFMQVASLFFFTMVKSD